MAGSISTRILLSGGKEFANQFKTIASNVKEATSSLKLLDKSMEQNGTTADGLRNRISQLTRVYDLHESAITLIENRMREMAATGKLTEQQQAEFTNEINNHRIAQREVADQLSVTTEQLERLGTQTDDTEKEMRELGSETKDAGKTLGDDFPNDTAKSIVKLQELVKVAKTVGKWIWDVGKDAVEYNAEMERYSATISAFFRTSGQGAEEAQHNTEVLIQNQKDLATQIGIGADVLIDANKMLIASGINGTRSQQAVSSLAKAIVATGGGNDELTRMVQNLQQIQNVGKASATDIKQFGMAGVDVYSLLADSTGKTVEELKKMDITFDMIVDALNVATQEGGKFFEASQVGATTLEGKYNVLKTTIRDGLGTAFQPFNDTLRDEIIPKAQELAEGIDWEALGVMMSDAAELAATTFGTLAETIGVVAEAYVTIKEAIDDWGNVSERVTNDVSQGYIGMAGSFKKAYDNELRFSQGTVPVVRNVRDMTSQVNQSIAGIPTSIDRQYGPTQSASTRLGQAAKSGVSGLSSEMSRYGSDAGSGFASGLSGSIGTIQRAASSAAAAVRRYMHFSRPDEGPLRDYEEWMPDMMQGFAKGIDDNVWRVQRAASNAAGAMAAATNYSTTNFNGGINLTVNAAPGMNENQIADVVMARMQEATRRKQAVWQ